MLKNWREDMSALFRRATNQHLEDLRDQRAREEGREREEREQEQRASRDRTPIRADQWVDNEYFCGSFARTMYPKLKEHFVRIVDSGAHEILLAGATRWGKTTLAIALQGRSKYELNCLASPQRTLHLQDESTLLYLNMNVTDAKARDAYFNRLSTWVRSTAYFQREFSPKPNLIHRLQFPKHILCSYAGANRKAAESEDLLFYVGDEVNLYDVVEKSKRAYQNDKYDAAEDIKTAVDLRMRGTFRRPDGSYPGVCKVVWLCKETYPDSFMRREIERATREGDVDSGAVYVIESTEWGMKPRRCNRCEITVDEEQHECHRCGERIRPVEYFWIRTADRLESARVVTDPAEAAELKAEAAARTADENRAPDERYRVIDVPTVYMREATRSTAALESFLRDQCGVPTRSIMRFYADKSIVVRSFRRVNEPPAYLKSVPADYNLTCRHPFTAMDTDTRDGVRIVADWLTRRVVDERGELLHREPLINPEAIRYAGIDAGLTSDAMGISVGHCAGFTEVHRMEWDEEANEARDVVERAPLIWFDFTIRVRPPPGGQIPFAWVRGLIYKLTALGFRIAKVTCDSFQHVAITQGLEERGYECEVVSVDRTPDAHNLLRQAYEEGRVSVYYHPQVLDELGALEKIVTGQSLQGRPIEKIDHPPGGEKDTADSQAHVAYQVEQAGVPADLSEHARVVEWRDQPMASAIEQGRAVEKGAAFERGDFERLMEIQSVEDDDFGL